MDKPDDDQKTNEDPDKKIHELLRELGNDEIDEEKKEQHFVELSELIYADLVNVCKYKYGANDSAEDIAQMTMVELLTKAGQYRGAQGPKSAKSFIFTIARNKAIDHIRAEKKRREKEVDFDDTIELVSEIIYAIAADKTYNDPEAALLEKEEQEHLNEHFMKFYRTLTPREKEIVNLLLEGNRPTEIAKSSDVSRSAVSQKINRIKVKYEKSRG